MSRPAEETTIASEKGRYVEVEGIRTFYVQAGSGPAVVLIHGAAPGACSLVNWKMNIEPLAAAGYSIYAFDQPGFGYTDNPQDHSLEFRVVHAKSFIKALGFESFYLIGNSQGAYIAGRIALEDPRSRGLILVSSGTLAPRGSDRADALARQHSEELGQFTPSLENVRSMTLKTLFRKELVSDQLVRARYEMSTGKNFEAQLARRKAPGARPIQEELKNLKCKTLILWGNNDQGAAVERALLLFKAIPEAELHIFDHCAHWVQWDQAERFNGIVGGFIKSLESRSARRAKL